MLAGLGCHSRASRSWKFHVRLCEVNNWCVNKPVWVVFGWLNWARLCRNFVRNTVTLCEPIMYVFPQGWIKVGCISRTHRPYWTSEPNASILSPPGVFCFHVHPPVVQRFTSCRRPCWMFFFCGFIMLYRGGSWSVGKLFVQGKKDIKTRFL